MCHVLIIEDEPMIAMLIREILEDAGATSFDFAASQNEAIAAANHRTPAMITSDVKLLEDTGPLAVEAIHRQVGPIPVLFISATRQDCEPCPEQARVISKPFAQAMVTEAFIQLSALAHPDRAFEA